MITKEILEKEIDYCKHTGLFTRNGKEAGHKSRYIRISIKGKTYSAHRLAWLYIYGYMPDYKKDLMIDHINQDKHDNRICNLRVIDRCGNAQNSKIYITNKSGVKGVSFLKRDKTWRSFIHEKNKQIYLGSSKDFFEAVCKRKSAENKIFI